MMAFYYFIVLQLYLSLIVEGKAGLKASASQELLEPPMNALKKLGQYLKNMNPPIVDDGAETTVNMAGQV